MWPTLDLLLPTFTFGSEWNQGFFVSPTGVMYMPGGSLEGSDPGGIRSGWDQGAKCQVQISVCQCVDR